MLLAISGRGRWYYSSGGTTIGFSVVVKWSSYVSIRILWFESLLLCPVFLQYPENEFSLVWLSEIIEVK